MFACVSLVITAVCKAVNDKHFGWERVTSVLDVNDSGTFLVRRTLPLDNLGFLAMHNFESIIFNLKSINDTFKYNLIRSLSKRIQFPSPGALDERFQKFGQFVEEHIISEKRVFLNNAKTLKLMLALGFKSMGIHEYNALNLYDDEHIRKLSITDSGIMKLK